MLSGLAAGKTLFLLVTRESGNQRLVVADSVVDAAPLGGDAGDFADCKT